MLSGQGTVMIPSGRRQGTEFWEGWMEAVSLGSRGNAWHGACTGVRRCKDLEGGWGWEMGSVSEAQSSPGWKRL